MYDLIHIIHLFSVFIYAGFLITDNLFLSKMNQTLNEDELKKARESFMQHVRKVVPYSLLVAVATGSYMFITVFGVIAPDGMNSFQIILSIKAFFGLWLGLRGFHQKFFKINPCYFKSHLFPFILVIIIIFLSQLMQSSFI